MVICRVIECGGRRGNGIFFQNSGFIGWGRVGIWGGAMLGFRVVLFFGWWDIRVAAYRIAMEGTQKRRYFASA